METKPGRGFANTLRRLLGKALKPSRPEKKPPDDLPWPDPLAASMKDPKVFDAFVRFVATNPQALHNFLAHPDVPKNVVAQTEFLKRLVSQKGMPAKLLKLMPQETASTYLGDLFREEKDLLARLARDPALVPLAVVLGSREMSNLDAANGTFWQGTFFEALIRFCGAHAAEILAHILARDPGLVRRMLMEPPLRDHAIAAMSSVPASFGEIAALYAANPAAGPAVADRIERMFSAAFSHPVVIAALIGSDEARAALAREVARACASTGDNVVSAFGPAIAEQVDGSPTALVDWMATGLAPDRRKAFVDAVVQTDRIAKLAPLMPESQFRRATERLEKAGSIDIAAFVKAASRKTTLPLNGGDFDFTSPKDISTILDEIFIKEEYYFECNRTPYIIDCGTNIGLSIAYFKSLFPDADIVAFEPAPHLYEIARKNIEAMGGKTVDLRQAAIVADPGEVVLLVDRTNSLAASITERRADRGGDLVEVSVEGISLEPFLDRPVDFLKMDIEGVEYQVLTSLGEKLKVVRNLFCEFHCDGPDDRIRLSRLLALLADLGFSYHIGRTSWAEQRYGTRPMMFAHRPVSYGIYAVGPADRSASRHRPDPAEDTESE